MTPFCRKVSKYVFVGHYRCYCSFNCLTFLLCTFVHFPTGWVRMRMDTSISTADETNSLLGGEGGICLHFLQSRKLRCCRRQDRRQSTVHRTVEFIFQIPPARYIKKNHIHKDVVFFMAEKEGFEPSIPFWGIHDFQSCALGQLRDFSIHKLLEPARV